MTKAPERIWAAECRATNSTMWWPDDAGGVGTQYIRTDLRLALVAAEREAVARWAEKERQTCNHQSDRLT